MLIFPFQLTLTHKCSNSKNFLNFPNFPYISTSYCFHDTLLHHKVIKCNISNVLSNRLINIANKDKI